MNKLKDISSVGFAEASTVGFPSRIRKKRAHAPTLPGDQRYPARQFSSASRSACDSRSHRHLTGGKLEIGAIKGNKDIDTQAGNVEISVPNSNDYGTVDAAVKVGSLDGGPFGDAGPGPSSQLKWSGPGKYTLHASLGASHLELKH